MNNWMSATSYAAFICMCASFIYLVFSLIRMWRQFRPVSEDDPVLAEALQAVTEDRTLQDLIVAVLRYREAQQEFRNAEPSRFSVEAAAYRVTAAERDVAHRFRRALLEREVSEVLAKTLLEVD